MTYDITEQELKIIKAIRDLKYGQLTVCKNNGKIDWVEKKERVLNGHE